MKAAVSWTLAIYLKIDVVATEAQWGAEGHSVMRSPLEVERSDESHTVSPSAATDSVSNDEVEWEVKECSSRDFLARFFPFLGSTGIRLGAGRFLGEANRFPTDNEGRFDVSPFKVSATNSSIRLHLDMQCLTPPLPFVFICRKPMHVHSQRHPKCDVTDTLYIPCIFL